MPDAPFAPGAATIRARLILVRALTFFRVAALAESLVAVVVAWGTYPRPVPAAVLMGVLIAESAVLLTLCWRSSEIRASWIGLDLAVTMAALLSGALLTAPREFGTWANFTYPYSLLAALTIGMAGLRLRWVVAATTMLAVLYVAVTVRIHHDPVWNAAANALSYYANSLVAWAVTGEMRRTGRHLDARARSEADHAGRLARERERLRASRLLHDRVLQTLETLTANRLIADPALRAQVATETAWLRRFVEVEEDGEEVVTELAKALDQVFERHRRRGLSLAVNDARLPDVPARGLPPDRLAALAGAVDEALTNITKHAGVDAATVHIAPDPDGVAVSVADQGRGFDPDEARYGLGLRQSVQGRLGEVGGRMRLESAPGRGTYLELWIPASRPGADATASTPGSGESGSGGPPPAQKWR